jgi:aspartate racemase
MTVNAKVLGIIGGVGPESTVDYYRRLLAAWGARRPGGSQPPLVIDSVDMQRMLALLDAGDLAGLVEYLAAEIGRLERAGADFALVSSNTPHVVFDDLQRRVRLPLLSIVETARDAARGLGLKRVGLFGTRFTMGGAFYPEVFARAGVEVVAPSPGEQGELHARYMGELVRGQFRDETRERFLAVADRLRAEEGIDGLVLGGTELPLLLRAPAHGGMPLLDTTALHVERAVARMLE